MMKNYPEFKNVSVIVTGVASGIGRAQAEKFLLEGAFVFGGDINDNEAVKNLKRRFPQTFRFKLCDVTELEQIKQFADAALHFLGGCEILLNTAGILDAYKPTLETDEELWDKIMNTNLKSIFRLTNAVLPSMLKQSYGVIINMASIAGMVAGGGGAAYTAAKHAIIGYTKQLDYDYAKSGIRACSIAPGAINTPMNAADFAGDAHMARQVAEETPAGRWAKPEEVAELTLFLASPRADYIHGANVPIDGGWVEK